MIRAKVTIELTVGDNIKECVTVERAHEEVSAWELIARCINQCVKSACPKNPYLIFEFIGAGRNFAQSGVERLELWNFTTRTNNLLKNAGINTAAELVSRSERSLRELRGFGAESLREVEEKLQERGLKLGTPIKAEAS